MTFCLKIDDYVKVFSFVCKYVQTKCFDYPICRQKIKDFK